MKKNYEDTSINISKEGFERPPNLSIKVDCWSPPTTTEVDSTATEQSTEEFEL